MGGMFEGFIKTRSREADTSGYLPVPRFNTTIEPVNEVAAYDEVIGDRFWQQNGAIYCQAVYKLIEHAQLVRFNVQVGSKGAESIATAEIFEFERVQWNPLLIIPGPLMKSARALREVRNVSELKPHMLDDMQTLMDDVYELFKA